MLPMQGQSVTILAQLAVIQPPACASNVPQLLQCIHLMNRLPLKLEQTLPCLSALRGPGDLAFWAANELSSSCSQISCIGGM